MHLLSRNSFLPNKWENCGFSTYPYYFSGRTNPEACKTSI